MGVMLHTSILLCVHVEILWTGQCKQINIIRENLFFKSTFPADSTCPKDTYHSFHISCIPTVFQNVFTSTC